MSGSSAELAPVLQAFHLLVPLPERFSPRPPGGGPSALGEKNQHIIRNDCKSEERGGKGGKELVISFECLDPAVSGFTYQLGENKFLFLKLLWSGFLSFTIKVSDYCDSDFTPFYSFSTSFFSPSLLSSTLFCSHLPDYDLYFPIPDVHLVMTLPGMAPPPLYV